VLIGIDPAISTELLEVLSRMGHGGEIVFADAFFLGDSLNKCVIYSDGIRICVLI
jgi:L-fucose mutarotase